MYAVLFLFFPGVTHLAESQLQMSCILGLPVPERAVHHQLMVEQGQQVGLGGPGPPRSHPQQQNFLHASRGDRGLRLPGTTNGAGVWAGGGKGAGGKGIFFQYLRKIDELFFRAEFSLGGTYMDISNNTMSGEIRKLEKLYICFELLTVFRPFIFPSLFLSPSPSLFLSLSLFPYKLITM